MTIKIYRLQEWARLALMLAGVVFLLVLTTSVFYVRRAALEVLGDIDGTAKQLTQTEAQLSASSLLVQQHVDRLVAIVSGEANIIRDSSRAQEAYWKTYGKQTSDVLAAALAAIDHTDRALNAGVLPAAELSLKQSVETQKSLTAAIQDVHDNAVPILTAAAATTRTTMMLVAQEAPVIDQTMHNVEAATEQTDQTAVHLEKTAEHLEQTMAYGEQYVKRLTSPGSMLWHAFLQVGSFVSSFGPALGRLF